MESMLNILVHARSYFSTILVTAIPLLTIQKQGGKFPEIRSRCTFEKNFPQRGKERKREGVVCILNGAKQFSSLIK